MKLEDYKTYELVKELEKRKGIEVVFVGPYDNANISVVGEESNDDMNINIEGPVLILIDKN